VVYYNGGTKSNLSHIIVAFRAHNLQYLGPRVPMHLALSIPLYVTIRILIYTYYYVWIVFLLIYYTFFVKLITDSRSFFE